MIKYKSIQVSRTTNLSLKMSAINASSSVPTSFDFIQSFKSLLERFESSEGIQNKIRILLEIFEKINKELALILAVETKDRWINFVCSIFTKITQFEKDYRLGNLHEVDEKLVDKFLKEIGCSKNMTTKFIKYYTGPSSSLSIETKKEIRRLESKRTLRNIKRVNYTGMDTIDSDCESDIWADLTVQKDPDYIFEDDEDD